MLAFLASITHVTKTARAIHSALLFVLLVENIGSDMRSGTGPRQYTPIPAAREPLCILLDPSENISIVVVLQQLAALGYHNTVGARSTQLYTRGRFLSFIFFLNAQYYLDRQGTQHVSQSLVGLDGR